MALPVLRPLLLLAIRLYQRHISPYKGFRCAYRVHTGCASCSAFGYRAIRRFGSFAGLVVLQRRLTLCGETWRRHNPPRPINYQAGECDPGCDFDCSPSGGGRKAAGCACDAAGECLPDFLEKWWEKRKQRRQHDPNQRQQRRRHQRQIERQIERENRRRDRRS